MEDHVIICGLGNVGFRTFEILHAAKQKIVIISDIARDELRWQVEEAGGIFLLGDARNDQLLIEAGIKKAFAIIAVTDQDMVNATIAMDARSLNPNIKVIVRMLDLEVGHYLSKAFGIQHVFSPSELAAPIFAKSLINSSILAQFDLDKRVYVISDASNRQNELNTNILVSDTTNSLYINSVEKSKKKKHFWFPFLRRLTYFRSPAFAHFRFFVSILFCVIIISSLFLKWAMPLSYTDALYFVVTTVTTVGYGDINYLHSPSILKIFGCLLMLAGAASIAVLFSSITEIILSKKLPSVLGGLPIPKKNHVIVIGAGEIGHKIVTTLLDEELSVVIIENNLKNRYSADINREVALVTGYLTSHVTLKTANIHTAKAILVITDDDIENLSISLAAKKMNPSIQNIIQVFNAKLENQLQTAMSLDKVLSVANIVAPYFAAAVFCEKVITAMKWQEHLVFLTSDSQILNNQKVTQLESLALNHKIHPDIQVHSITLR